MRASLSALVALALIAACSGAQPSPTTSTPPAETTTGPVTTATTTTSSVPTTTPSTTTTTLPTTTTTVAPTTTSGSPGSLQGRVIVIDPGHNGMNWAHPDEIGQLVDIGNGTKACNTTGTQTKDGYLEAEFTWSVALLTRARLEDLGATVVLTREDNEGWGPCIDRRAAVGNEAGADAVVSVHADGGPEPGRGFHVIHPASVAGLTDDIAAESLRLARALHEAYQATRMPVADYVARDGFSERDDLGGLNLSDVPAVFLEAGNMRNAADAVLLIDPGFQEEIARSIATALLEFFAP